MRIRDVYPGSRILIFTHPGSRIPDPRTAIKERGDKKLVSHTFFCSHKFHKIEHYFICGMLKKKIWANFQRIKNFFPKKLSLCSQKYGFGIRDPEKPILDPGSRGSKRHRILDPGSATLRVIRLKLKNVSNFLQCCGPGSGIRFCFDLSGSG